MVNEELKKSHIDYKLGDRGYIQNINSLATLKELIEDNPDDVYLIDDAKIIKKNIINSKIKFLNPKDGIDEEYLKSMGIDEVSVDSYAGITKYILRKMKSLGFDENDEFSERDEIQSTISDIVREVYDEENEKDENREDYQLNDDLKSLLTSSADDEFDDSDDEELDEAILSLDDLEDIKEVSMENKKGSKEILSLDDLTESDILEAFGGEPLKVKDSSNKEVSITLNSKEEIQDFLTKLLNSKALEITVKVKE